MPRFRLDEHTSKATPVLSDGSGLRCADRKESGDARALPANKLDYLKGVTEQKREFSKYIRSRRPKTGAGSERNETRPRRKSSSYDSCSGIENVTIASDSTNVKDSPAEENGRSDDVLACRSAEDEDFYKILQAKAPNLQETTSLLDQVLELRSDLEDRVAELRELAEEMRKVTKILKYDPFVSKTKIENEGSIAKVISSVRTMQNLCAEMNKHSSETSLSVL